MRASDADRDVVQGALADAYADGRLTREEYEERAGTTLAARTLGELPALVADLVPAGGAAAAARPAPARAADLRAQGARKWRKDVEEATAGLLVPGAVLTVIWLTVAGGGFFWPLVPMLFLGLNLIKTVVRREAAIEQEVRRLEKQAAREAIGAPGPGQGEPGDAREQ
jgi:hypothetical protein